MVLALYQVSIGFVILSMAAGRQGRQQMASYSVISFVSQFIYQGSMYAYVWAYAFNPSGDANMENIFKWHDSKRNISDNFYNKI